RYLLRRPPLLNPRLPWDPDTNTSANLTGPFHISGLSSSFVQRLSRGASRLAALLLRQILPVSSVVPPCHPGAAREIRCTTDEDRPLEIERRADGRARADRCCLGRRAGGAETGGGR